MNPTNQPTPAYQGSQPAMPPYAALPQTGQTPVGGQPLGPAFDQTQDTGSVPGALQPSVPVSTPANDGNLLEEAIAQVRQAIAGTKMDPLQQVNAINRVKAVYIQKRFGRTIKGTDN